MRTPNLPTGRAGAVRLKWSTVESSSDLGQCTFPITALLILALCTGLQAQEGEEYVGDEMGDVQGCLVLDGPVMHEFGSELPFLHVGLGACAELAAGAGKGTLLVWHLDGEELGRRDFQPETVRLTMPLAISAGPHELVVSLRTGGALSTEESEEQQTLDEAVYLFFSSDFRPEIAWEFPPANYIFKRNSQRFLRFGANDVGDQLRCQDGAASCAGMEPFVYYASYYLNGQIMGEDLRQIYMLGLSGLGDGDYEALVVIADKHKHPLGVNHTVHFSVRLTEEYTDDGSLPDALSPVTPCPTDEDSRGSCRNASADERGDVEGKCQHIECGQHGSLVDGVCVLCVFVCVCVCVCVCMYVRVCA